MNFLVKFVLLLILVAYVAVGGIVFHYFESDNEGETRDLATLNIQDFLENKTCVDAEELKTLLVATFKAYQSGQFTLNNTVDPVQTNWDSYSSIFFAMTVVTTIGYGNISPVTLRGRIFCVAFAVVGIPLFLVVAATIGTDIFSIVRRAQKRCFKEDINGALSKGAKACGSIFYIVLGVGLFIIVPGIIFAFLEEWTYAEGLYYSFITLTTIGFGDFVPGKPAWHGIYRLCVAAWILLGLSWMAGVISSIQDYYMETVKERDDALSTQQASRRNSRSEGRINAVVDSKPRHGSQPELARGFSVETDYGGTPRYNRATSFDVETASARGNGHVSQPQSPTSYIVDRDDEECLTKL